ncbi:MAG: hypothetical protein ACHQ4H_01880 [Ktedonobacterales bacterium]
MKSHHAQRMALVLAAVGVLSIALVACQAPGVSVQASNGASNGANVFHTPNPGNLTPTPAFPAFTIGAWPSDYSPGPTGTITIMVSCRIQDPTMATAAKPAAGQTVTISVGAPVNQLNNVTTDASGLATWTLTINDTQAGTPVVVDVSTNFHGQTYSNSTFFTPSPGGAPKATPGATQTPGGGGGTPVATGLP